MKLPDNIISFELLRINRGREKFCKCEKPTYEIDTKNRIVSCRLCGAFIDPYEALYSIALNKERFGQYLQSMLDQAHELENWQPHLIYVRKLESIWRSKDMLPTCPHCKKPIEAKELYYSTHINKNYINPSIEPVKTEQTQESFL